MDFLTFILSAQAREVTATALMVGVVALLLTGRLVPLSTHKRELAQANHVAEQHEAASTRKDVAIGKLLDQNSNLLAGVRIADKFYGDFVRPLEERTQPRAEVPDVGQPT